MSADKRFPYLEVDAPEARAEELAAELFELGAAGVEIRDETTLMRGAGPGQVTLVASFDALAAAEDAARALPADLAVRTGELIGDAWRDKYKEHFRPFALTPTITVAPPWVEKAPEGAVLWMDPGRAFGTGLHATTALVARALERHRDRYRGQAVLDVGTGSGILALVALLLGAARARAIDNDPEVIAVARENAERNGLAARLEVDDAPLSSIDGEFPMVVANIEARVLCALAPELSARVAAGGLLVLSGVLASQRDDVRAAFEELTLVASDCEGDGRDAWVALTLERAR